MMTLRRRFIAGLGAVLIMLGLAPATPAGQTVELTIDTGGLAWHGDCPITGGIPIARGALKDVRAVRLMIQGAEVPAQARALAQWPDGSVKWLLLSFVAPADARPVVEFGAGVSRRDVSRPLCAVASGGGVTIDTGVIRFAIRKDGSGFIDDLWLDPTGEGKYADGERMVQAGDRRTSSITSTSRILPSTRCFRGPSLASRTGRKCRSRISGWRNRARSARW